MVKLEDNYKSSPRLISDLRISSIRLFRTGIISKEEHVKILKNIDEKKNKLKKICEDIYN